MMDEATYKGKTVLIGISYVDRAGEIVGTRQMFGRIDRITEETGVEIVLNSGEVVTLPPYSGAFQPAEPGDYTLQESLEVVRDPDFMTVWRIPESNRPTV